MVHVYLGKTMNFITRGVVNFCMTDIKALMSLLSLVHYAFSAVEFLSIFPGKACFCDCKALGLGIS